MRWLRWRLGWKRSSGRACAGRSFSSGLYITATTGPQLTCSAYAFAAQFRSASAVSGKQSPVPLTSTFSLSPTTRVTIPRGDATDPAAYVVRLYFAEPDDPPATRRIFDVNIQGKKVLESFDILAAAGGPRRGVVKEFRSVLVKDDLRITLRAVEGLPLLCGIEAIAEIRSCLPDVKIIVLTMVGDERVVEAAMEAGADAYILKDAGGEALLRALEALQRGECLTYLRQSQRPSTRLSRRKEPGGSMLLSPREKEILRLVARGMTNQDVAQTLDISENTVKAHVSHILDRLDVSDRTQAAVWAAQLGLISPGEDT